MEPRREGVGCDPKMTVRCVQSSLSIKASKNIAVLHQQATGGVSATRYRRTRHPSLCCERQVVGYPIWRATSMPLATSRSAYTWVTPS
jgi:hypothetical protein